MKTLKLLLAVFAIVAFESPSSAQYWGEYNTSFFAYAGFSSLNSQKTGTLPGATVGIGHIRQVGFGHVYWDVDLRGTFNSATVNKLESKTSNVRISLDLLRQFELADKTYLFPYVGLGCKAILSGKSTWNNKLISRWVGDHSMGGSRFNTGIQFGMRFFMKKLYVGAEYHIAFLKTFGDYSFRPSDKTTLSSRFREFSATVGFRF